MSALRHMAKLAEYAKCKMLLAIRNGWKRILAHSSDFEAGPPIPPPSISPRTGTIRVDSIPGKGKALMSQKHQVLFEVWVTPNIRPTERICSLWPPNREATSRPNRPGSADTPGRC